MRIGGIEDDVASRFSGKENGQEEPFEIGLLMAEVTLAFSIAEIICALVLVFLALQNIMSG
jgi:hypothetical protein